MCQTRNWYTGNQGDLGNHKTLGPADPSTREHFTEDAPALLGFDESIDDHCVSHGGSNPGGPSGHAISCVRANVNILSLYGERIPYNTCRNVEWQICAARGTLPGQSDRERQRRACAKHPKAAACTPPSPPPPTSTNSTAGEDHGRSLGWRGNALRARMQPPPPPAEPPGLRTIRFAKAPSTLEPYAGPHPIGSCSGYAPEGCRQGYASSDIFFMESCLYSMMCSNRDELFSLKAGEDFECELDEEGFERMREFILRPNYSSRANRTIPG